jgi:hypothetical protein
MLKIEYKRRSEEDREAATEALAEALDTIVRRRNIIVAPFGHQGPASSSMRFMSESERPK